MANNAHQHERTCVCRIQFAWSILFGQRKQIRSDIKWIFIFYFIVEVPWSIESCWDSQSINACVGQSKSFSSSYRFRMVPIVSHATSMCHSFSIHRNDIYIFKRSVRNSFRLLIDTVNPLNFVFPCVFFLSLFSCQYCMASRPTSVNKKTKNRSLLCSFSHNQLLHTIRVARTKLSFRNDKSTFIRVRKRLLHLGALC